jgi:hypothetical protein
MIYSITAGGNKNYKYRLEQKDEQGLLIQFMQSGGTFETAKQARTALNNITNEFFAQLGESVRKELEEVREDLADVQYEWDMSNGRRSMDVTLIIKQVTGLIHVFDKP